MTHCTFDIDMMKQQTPYIVYFEDLIEKYQIPSDAGYTYTRDLFGESPVEKARTEILDLLLENKEFLLFLEEKMLNYVQEMTIQSPHVYVARTKDVKTEIEYFTAKVFWEQKGGIKKEIKIYLGKAEDYGNDTRSPLARKEATIKMAETLRRRKDAGEI
jgi:hypothetical protein